MNTKDKYEKLISSLERQIATKSSEIKSLKHALNAVRTALKAAEESGTICDDEKQV